MTDKCFVAELLASLILAPKHPPDTPQDMQQEFIITNLTQTLFNSLGNRLQLFILYVLKQHKTQ